MAIMDELTEQEVSRNKAIRGYIIRALAKGNHNALLVRQITNALVADGLIYSPDISKHLEYLEEAGYITFTSRVANAYNASEGRRHQAHPEGRGPSGEHDRRPRRRCLRTSDAGHG